MPDAHAGAALVALESSVIAQGLPRPHNLALARTVEAAIRDEGAEPRTTAILKGRPVAGVDDETLVRLSATDGLAKANLANLAAILATRRTAATTVATTAWIAHRAGIRVMATGGIGGVHRTVGEEPSHDVSSDLTALASIPVTVVSSGPKTLLDLPATRERLETAGVTVVGWRTDRMPGFWVADSGLPVDVRCDSATQVADIVGARDRHGLPAAVLVCVPVPESHAVEPGTIEPAIREAMLAARERGVAAGAVTPFVLAWLRETVGDRLLNANLALLERNARVAARVALALAGRPDRLS